MFLAIPFTQIPNCHRALSYFATFCPIALQMRIVQSYEFCTFIPMFFFVYYDLFKILYIVYS